MKVIQVGQGGSGDVVQLTKHGRCLGHGGDDVYPFCKMSTSFTQVRHQLLHRKIRKVPLYIDQWCGEIQEQLIISECV